ncbi:MAG: acyltransferase [Pseudomonadota bacterium]
MVRSSHDAQLFRSIPQRRGGAAARPLEGLRGLAVFLVFLVHFTTLARPLLGASAIADAVRAIGNTGVDLFFVLSGYLIYASLMARPQAFLPFMARRVQRIYPAFSVVFALYVGLSLLLPGHGKLPEPPYFYLLQNFLLLPGMLPIAPMITVAWSLSYELFFYLAIPLLIAVLRLRTDTLGYRRVLALLLVLAGPPRFAMFACGMLVHELREAPAPRSALVPVISGLLLLEGSDERVLVALAWLLLCRCCLGRPHDWLARTLSWAPLRWLGNMSYSYYLLHGLALKGAFLLVGEGGPLLAALLLVPMFAWSLLPSAALYLLVERPFSLRPITGSRPEPCSSARAAAAARRQ